MHSCQIIVWQNSKRQEKKKKIKTYTIRQYLFVCLLYIYYNENYPCVWLRMGANQRVKTSWVREFTFWAFFEWVLWQIMQACHVACS